MQLLNISLLWILMVYNSWYTDATTDMLMIHPYKLKYWSIYGKSDLLQNDLSHYKQIPS